MNELKKFGLYWHQPANSLVFMRRDEHSKLHSSGENNKMFGRHHSEETKRKISFKNKGRVFSEEIRKRLSEAHKGKSSGMKGKHASEITRLKM